MTDSISKNSSGHLLYTEPITTNDNAQHEHAEETMIFQCANCSSVLGDTTGWACAEDVLRTISLKRVSDKVQITDELDTSKNGTDMGSTYNLLKCEICKEKIGKMYRTTPSHLDKLRGLFTMFVDKLSSYQVGSSSQTNSTVKLEDTLSFSECKEMYTQVNKIKQVLVSLDSRIKNIETFLCEEYDDQSETTVNENMNNPVQTPLTDDEHPLPTNSNYPVRDQYSRRDSMPCDGIYESKNTSPQQPSSRFSSVPHVFHRKDEENIRNIRTDDPRQTGGDGLSSRPGSSRSYIENLKRKMGGNSRSESSMQLSKRSKY